MGWKSLKAPRPQHLSAVLITDILQNHQISNIYLSWCGINTNQRIFSFSPILYSGIQNIRMAGQKCDCKFESDASDKLERWAICMNASGQKLVSPTFHFLTVSGNSTLRVWCITMYTNVHSTADKSGFWCVLCKHNAVTFNCDGCTGVKSVKCIVVVLHSAANTKLGVLI